jgi:hypothetical protein
VLSVCYVAFRRVLQLVFLLFRSTEFKELEIVVLSHELGAAASAGAALRTRSFLPGYHLMVDRRLKSGPLAHTGDSRDRLGGLLREYERAA